MRKIRFIVFLSVLLNPVLCAQQAHWKTKETRDGSVSVSYDLSELVDENGKKKQVLEYVAKTTAMVSLNKCVAVIKNDEKHKEFIKEAKVSWRIKEISEKEWLTYYVLKPPWPMPEADVITRYVLEEDSIHRRFIITGIPAPDQYPDQDMPRMKHNHTRYTLTDQGNGTVDLEMYSSSVLLVSAPKWLVRSWIPKGPAEMLLGLIKLAE